MFCCEPQGPKNNDIAVEIYEHFVSAVPCAFARGTLSHYDLKEKKKDILVTSKIIFIYFYFVAVFPII